MTAKALTYAEVTLGVHRVYTDATEARDLLDQTFTELKALGDRKRDLHDRITDQELLIAAAERGKHPDMSAAGMEKHLKIALNADGDLRTLRDELRMVLASIEGLEYDARMNEHDIKIAVGRMTELGGYLNYLAAVKNHTTPTKPSEPENIA